MIFITGCTSAEIRLYTIQVLKDDDKTTTRQMLNLCIPMMPFTPDMPDLVWKASISLVVVLLWCENTEAIHMGLARNGACQLVLTQLLVFRLCCLSGSHTSTKLLLLGNRHSHQSPTKVFNFVKEKYFNVIKLERSLSYKPSMFIGWDGASMPLSIKEIMNVKNQTPHECFGPNIE